MLLYYPITWQEWSELILLTIGLYKLHDWLSQDVRTPLLCIGYGYCLFLLVAYYAPLTTFLPLIPLITPTMLVLIVLLHKNTLQRDLIPYKQSPLAPTAHPDWLTELLRAAVTTLNSTQSVAILFEYTDELAPFLHTPYTLQTLVQPELLTFLLHRSTYCSNTMLWVTHTGIVISNNATWRLPTTYSLPQIGTASENLKELTDIYTFKTNSLVCFIDQNTRTATISVAGTSRPQISMHQAHSIIAKHLTIPVPKTSFTKAHYEKPTASFVQKSTP
jgi:hypothetical protein